MASRIFYRAWRTTNVLIQRRTLQYSKSKQDPPARIGWAPACICVLAVLAATQVVIADPNPKQKCVQWLAWDHETVSVLSAELVAMTGELPQHCQIEGRVGSTVGFELRLPTQWNGKFYMVGNGGYQGAFFDQSNGLKRGYATASTDTGHRGPSPTFAFNNRQAEIDFAYRAVHVSAQATKQMIEKHYGLAPRKSYFRGCSTGGRQGLIEAQRYPEDFDGLSIGAPIYDYTEKQVYSAAWVSQALFAQPESYLPREKLKALGAAVYRNCDGRDGFEDGLIDDPRRCDFDPQRDLTVCSEGDQNDCFSTAQIAAIAKIYAGPGPERYPGHVVGGEWMDNASSGFTGGWDIYFIGSHSLHAGSTSDGEDAYGGNDFEPVQLRNARSFFQYLAFEEDRPEFDVLVDFDFESVPDFTLMTELMNADDADLTGLHQHGGKILMWHGWADVGLNPLRTIKYFDRVHETMGHEIANDVIRLFMVPGMYHCSGGPGPDRFDDLSALEQWVEADIAPTQLVASKLAGEAFGVGRGPGGMSATSEGAEVTRTRLVCAYPMVARYLGVGSIDQAENFACRQPDVLESQSRIASEQGDRQ